MIAVLFVALGSSSSAEGETDACRRCHRDESFRVRNKKIYDYFQEWNGSAHDRAGLSCTACHGGDPAKDAKEEAHRGILSEAEPTSPLYFKNIPKTCGGCHPKILGRFEKSRHYAQLEAAGRGPNCVTCHGSLNTRIFASTMVERSCSKCHNARTGNRPEILVQAREILGRLSHADGYRKGLRFYYRSIGRPEAMARVDLAYSDIVQFWHEFDFQRLGPRSEELLAELKALYRSAQEDRGGARPEAP